MVEIVDINDQDSLEAWLQEQPQEVSVWVAHRVAMRLLPAWWDFTQTSTEAQEGDLTALPILRCILISGVARSMPTPDIKAAAAAAYAAATHTAAYAAATAAAFAAAAFATTDLWKLTRADCAAIAAGDDLDYLALWGGEVNPFAETWAEVKSKLTAASPADTDWSFWIKWYDDALAGHPPNWKMLEQIALIDPKDWDQGAERVNFLIGQIEQIEQEFALKATPYPEVLSYDTEYKTEPLSSLPAATLQDARDRIADVARSMRGGGNQYAALTDEADLLEMYLDKYPDRAIRLFEVCHKVTGHVATHVANGVLPENDNLIGDVVGDLQNSADDIYNFDADVRQTVDARAKLRFAALDQGQRQQVEQFAEAVAQNAEAGLAAEICEDAAEVMAEVDPEGESKPARYRLGSRLVRVLALGGAGLVSVLAAVEPAVSGTQFLWAIAKSLIGF